MEDPSFWPEILFCSAGSENPLSLTMNMPCAVFVPLVLFSVKSAKICSDMASQIFSAVHLAWCSLNQHFVQLLLPLNTLSRQHPADSARAVIRQLSDWRSTSLKCPGCVSTTGQPEVTRVYGLMKRSTWASVQTSRFLARGCPHLRSCCLSDVNFHSFIPRTKFSSIHCSSSEYE